MFRKPFGLKCTKQRSNKCATTSGCLCCNVNKKNTKVIFTRAASFYERTQFASYQLAQQTFRDTKMSLDKKGIKSHFFKAMPKHDLSMDNLFQLGNNKKMKEFVLAGSTIFIYYFFSISLTFYNRYLFVTYKYPLSITIIHLIIKFVASALIREFLNLTVNWKRCRLSKTPRITLDWSTYLRKIVPLGLASAVDIGFSNWSLQYITVTLYTMSKSTVILFILFFSLLFKLEKWVNSLQIFLCQISLH